MKIEKGNAFYNFVNIEKSVSGNSEKKKEENKA